MNISDRITSLTPAGDDGWGLFYRSRERIAAGEPIIELTIGEHDIRTDPSILDAMQKAAADGHTGYAAVPGTRALRETVAKRVEAQTGVPTSPSNVLITPGGQSALFAAHMAVLNAGDRAGFIDPYYTTYPGTIRGAGGTPVAVRTGPETQFQPTSTDLGVLTGARSLLVNSPNNPTGVVYSDRTLDTISEACKSLDLWLISDEVYDTQIWEGTHISPRALPDMQARTLVVGSMSKSHAMTGSRIGWLIGPEPVIAHLANLATHTTYGVPGFIQDAACFALNAGKALEETVAAPFRRRRDIAARVLAGQNVVKSLPAMGAMYLMLDVRETGYSGNDFAEKLLDEHQIAVMPGESFGASAAGHLRVAMTVEDTKFEHALSTLVGFAAELS